jgi:phosphohistidine swiveling domain-containing protein/glycerol-3-phosphate acyltransferase PlsY
MDWQPIWGALLIFIFCPLLGGLPLTAWGTRLITGKRLKELGTGNVGVSAAFYHGGKPAGVWAVLVEAGKGILAVLLARSLFPEPAWELVALLALVAGRYWLGKGAGTTNVVWGCIAYNWIVALLIFVIGGVSFTFLRERQQGRISILILLPLVIALYRHSVSETLVAISISSLLGWIYQQLPDDLDLESNTAQPESRRLFKFFRGDRALLTLDQPLERHQAGEKAATLSQLKRWGYAVPPGWVLPAGDDPEPLIEWLDPSKSAPLVVRSSAIGEDSQQASAAGQYRSILQVISRYQLRAAIAECQDFYNHPTAIQYRQDHGIPEAEGMAVLVQQQVQGLFSGVAFSRDPLQTGLNAVAIEGLPGAASQVVSGQRNPECYQVLFPDPTSNTLINEALIIQGNAGQLPPDLIRQVALLARDLETRYHGIPQDIEWSFDGETLWLLQSRPITTLLPIWTRKIAAEVIPGVIRPLTWSVNRPLTCGVWGDLFTLVLGRGAAGLDFLQTADLHQSHAYFNASLLTEIFRQMGLPPESLEFLTRGAKLGKPSPWATLRALPGLLRLIGRELRLAKDFRQDHRQQFIPLLTQLSHKPADPLDATALLARIRTLLETLRPSTYFSILAPLSAALRQAIFRVDDEVLDTSHTPETAAVRSLQAIANASRSVLGDDLNRLTPALLFTELTEKPEGIIQQLERFLDNYGYMSPTATDIAVPTWREDPQPIRDLFSQYLFNPLPTPVDAASSQRGSWKVRLVQQRVNLKGEVSAIYNQLLAHLRWSFVALEKIWLTRGILQQPGDIFFLELSEIAQAIESTDAPDADTFAAKIAARRSQFDQDSQLPAVPFVVYGKAPALATYHPTPWQASSQIQGLGASPGQVEGQVKILLNLQGIPVVDRQTILVVPYTDAGWAPLLAQVGGIISEVGGRLSHGAIVAREYGIPAVMDIPHATQRLRDGQWVRLNGQQGTIEVLD